MLLEGNPRGALEELEPILYASPANTPIWERKAEYRAALIGGLASTAVGERHLARDLLGRAARGYRALYELVPDPMFQLAAERADAAAK
jgi:hypothetical protein